VVHARTGASPTITEVPPEPFKPAPKPSPDPSMTEVVAAPATQAPAKPEPVPVPKPKPESAPPPNLQPRKDPVAPATPAPVLPPKPEPKPAAAPAAIPQGSARMLVCLITEAGAPAGEGYRIVFSLSGRADEETPPTNAGGCAVMDIPVSGSIKFKAVSVKGPGSRALKVVSVPGRSLYEGETETIQVQITP